MNYTGDKISEKRKEKKLSQERLAELIGVSRQTVYKWEYGIVIPSEENIMSLCAVFNVDKNYFYPDNQEQNEIAVTYTGKKSVKKLLIISIILGVLFAIGLCITVVFGFITLTPNKGFISKNYLKLNVYHFVAVLVTTILVLIAEIIVVIFIKKKSVNRM